MMYTRNVRIPQFQLQMAIALLLSGLIFLSCKKDTVSPSVPIPAVDTNMVFIDASNTNIHYSGRIDFSNPKAPAFWFPGISIKASFQGPSIDVVIKDDASGTDQGTNYYNIFIDQQLHTVLKVNAEDTLYKIARNLTDANHTIEVFKRTEAQVGSSSFKGFCLQANKNLTASAKPAHKIEFIGDSYTCGYGNELSIPAPPNGNPDTGFHSVNENNYTAWGAIVARELDAEYHCTAYSGRGIYRNNNGAATGVLPSIYNRINPDDASSQWNTATYIPDVIVIHLGTNDFAPEQLSTPDMVDSAAFVSGYINFITTLRSYYPAAKIICVRPNSLTDYYPVGLKALTRMTRYTKAVTDHFVPTDANVFYFALAPQNAPYGEDWHPSAATHQSMAAQIKTFIKTRAGW
ncbi:SGNH/GDSL hydrolase family protein [Cytophaga hutchinsonii]|nr:SGNH/GDSL hydrolase family protein [Cytophaga hutchinsonii]SFX89690.1 Lysophospholipase L1 [Cytophaga hutchinsonii ATCC 33406]